MAKQALTMDIEVDAVEAPSPNGKGGKRISIPLTEDEARALAQLVESVTDKRAVAAQDDNGKWSVTLETEVIVVKRLTTLNAVMKFVGRARTQPLTDDEDDELEDVD